MPLFGWRRLPPLARDLPPSPTEAEPLFEARVRARFPVGTPEDEVMRELEAQGFRYTGPKGEPTGHRSLNFERKRFVFTTLWSVRWRARDGKVEEIWGIHGVTGP